MDFRRSWRVFRDFEVFDYFSADRGLELVASEFSLATGSWVRESIYIYIYINIILSLTWEPGI